MEFKVDVPIVGQSVLAISHMGKQKLSGLNLVNLG